MWMLEASSPEIGLGRAVSSMATSLCRLEQETGMYIRFAIGEVPEEHRESIEEEERTYGSFLRIPIKVCQEHDTGSGTYRSFLWQCPHDFLLREQDEYHALSYKTMALWKLAEEQFDAQFIIKIDDDNYVRLDRLAHALGQWVDLGAGALAAVMPLTADVQSCPRLMTPSGMGSKKDRE